MRGDVGACPKLQDRGHNGHMMVWTTLRCASAIHARSLRCVGAVLFWSAVSLPAAAWSNHALGTWPALAALPAVAQAQPVKAESLESFLVAERAALGPLLEQQERWARAQVPTYPPRPDALAFQATGATPAELRRRFLAAVRVNPAVPLHLFVQVPPGTTPGGRPRLSESEVTTLTRDETTRNNVFVGLREGESVAVVDVVATASDEPDHGMDIGLWENNGTSYGRSYGLGKQPFGANPAVEFSSQAPFHIGFFHESAIVYKAAPFLLRTYPEYRIHLWRTLSQHAFASGHPYWGWRFAGWALHYVQDLTQPYHATVLPGVGVPKMLWINTLDLVGIHGPKERAVTFVTNRHLALENYQLHRVRAAYLEGRTDDAALRAFADTRTDASTPPYSDASPRATITRQSNAEAAALDALLEASLPPRYTSDPDYVFGETETGVDLNAVLVRRGGAAEAAMTAELVRLLGRFGAQTRAFVRALATAPR